MRAVISTNGTLITKEKARELKGVGLSYVGISLDGMEEVHDRFRGVPGAFRKALEGVANCQAEGLKVGLRFTINKRNVGEIPGIFRLLADGYSVRQIGDALNISPKTVETHKYSVLTKLRAGSINELTKMAIRLGLVSL